MTGVSILGIGLAASLLGLFGRCEPAETLRSAPPRVDAWFAGGRLPAAVRPGAEGFAESGCLQCHTYRGAGSSNLGGSDLTTIGARRDAGYLARYIENPRRFGDPVMPAYASMGERNVRAIARFLAASKTR